MKTQLIETTSPLYLRRLVRELNGHGGDGFYCELAGVRTRCILARFSHGQIEVRPAGFGRIPYQRPSSYVFENAYGEEICASRKTN